LNEPILCPNLIKIRSPYLLPIFHRLFTSHRAGDLKNAPLGFASVVNMNVL